MTTPPMPPAASPREQWHVEDSRNGKRCSIQTWGSKAQTEWHIERWRERDRKGGRPDLHEVMPHLVAVEGI